MRIFPSKPPFPPRLRARWNEQDLWPAWWVDCPSAGDPPFVSAYRLKTKFPSPEKVRIHVSADERYILFLDETRLGRGPERGDPLHWFYESYELEIPAGEHVLWAIVWSLGERSAEAQMSVEPGFLLAAEGKHLSILSTGLAEWEACLLPGWDFLDPHPAHWRGDRFRVSAPFPTLESLSQFTWQPVRRVFRAAERIVDWTVHNRRRIRPASLPPMLSRMHGPGRVRLVASPRTDERESVRKIRLRENRRIPKDWQAFSQGQEEILIPAHSKCRVIFDLENYLTAYPELTVSGGTGALIRLGWEEACRAAPDPGNFTKEHRDEIEGKYFTGIADEFLPDGSSRARYAPLWWQAGRYLELLVSTKDEPLTLHSLTLEETRYPLEMASTFRSGEARLDGCLPLLVRGMQADSNETFFDSPYYEELQYIGDVRLESLCTYSMSRDDRLPRKAMSLYDSSRRPDGFLQSRYPCRIPQVIAPFSLWWVGMLWDYAHWRDDPAFVRSLLPGMRATLEAFRRCIGGDGLLHAPEGWNIMDWVPAWDLSAGVPPEGVRGVSGLLNWQLVYALSLAAQLERELGEPEYQALYERWSVQLASAAHAAFWDEKRGLLADDRQHRFFSEHTQSMAVLSTRLDAFSLARIADGLRKEKMQRATYYFSHYLIEAYRLLGREDLIYTQLVRWHTDMVLNGLKTPLEMLDPSRSDCHAWSSHPLYHYFATVLGIRPAGIGFRTIEISPLLGELEWAEGTLIHPAGEIHVMFRRSGKRLSGEIEIPENVEGKVNLNGEAQSFWGKIIF